MHDTQTLLHDYLHVRAAARASEDGSRCAVAPAPELNDRIQAELEKVRSAEGGSLGLLARAVHPSYPGLNDGLIIPPEDFPLGTPMSAIRSVAADRAPLRGTLRVIVVLVDFSDKHMAQTQQHFRDLFFSQGVIPTKSVREYYADVTHGLIDIQGDVVGPFRMPMTIAQYAHGASGLGPALPNATTMARDAVIASNPSVNFTPYDNDGNGFVDAFIVIHAGSGGEQTGNVNDIWSHKWTLDGGARTVDSTKIFGYLTVPEDCKIGVCCHELGHLLFGFPDLYDTDSSSEGIGNWCLMAAGSWGGGGNTPVHPSAWCKANQGWVAVDNRTANGALSIPDVKSSHTVYRLMKNGAAGTEYFLMENRQRTGFDASLPGAGLLIFHIDESISGNTDENHYKVALMQADGHRDMEIHHSRGDAGDPFPGTANNTSFTAASTPNSKTYANATTCVAVTGISPAAAVMTANVAVRCLVKPVLEKPILDTKLAIIDKGLAKEKPLVDKAHEKLIDNKLTEGGGLGGGLGGNLGGGTGQGTSTEAALSGLHARVTALESAVGGGKAPATPQPFIGRELRPDLSQGALIEEEDFRELQEQMRQGSAASKRLFDSKLKEG